MNGYSQRISRCVLPIVIAVGPIVMFGAPERAVPFDNSEPLPVSLDRAGQPNEPWKQVPIESRELWKFRLTRVR